MEILLKQDISGLGKAGEVRKVKPGYARNYLLPRGLAIPATVGLRNQATQIKDAAERRRNRELATARSFANRISQQVLHFHARAGESGRLYGSITAADIAESLSKRLGQEIDRRRMRLEHSLRDLGTHEVTFHVAPEVDAIFKVVIEAEGEIEKSSLSAAELEAAAHRQGVDLD